MGLLFESFDEKHHPPAQSFRDAKAWLFAEKENSNQKLLLESFMCKLVKASSQLKNPLAFGVWVFTGLWLVYFIHATLGSSSMHLWSEPSPLVAWSLQRCLTVSSVYVWYF